MEYDPIRMVIKQWPLAPIRQNGELLVPMCRGESHFSQKSPWANVGESGESGQSRLANVDQCIESGQNRLANVGASKIGRFMHK